MTAENGGGAAATAPGSMGFNEAAADDRGKPGWPGMGAACRAVLQ